ncbi:MAG: ParB N-terminal domain-containing protein [Hyphomicrobiaceae bacterium]
MRRPFHGAQTQRQPIRHDPVVVHKATSIPLDRLVVSEANVRSTGADDADAIAGLAHSISQRSLLQSLMVRPHASKQGIYEVRRCPPRLPCGVQGARSRSAQGGQPRGYPPPP